MSDKILSSYKKRDDNIGAVKTYLYVPYSQKDICKENGGRFDPDYEYSEDEICSMTPRSNKGRWFYNKKSNGKHFHSINYTKLDKFFLRPQRMVPYNVPYADREEAKKYGLKFTNQYVCSDGYKAKTWYLYEHDIIDPSLPFEKSTVI